MDLNELQAAYGIEEFIDDAAPILHSARVCQMNGFMQHGNTSTLDHVIAVAYYSVAYARAHHVSCDERSLLRGALLHDYFLYDWHEAGDGSHRLHGFRHPRFALENAQCDFDLNDIECDIIVHHMHPLVPVRPKTTEGRIVSSVDKRCSLRETMQTIPYPRFGDEGPAARAGFRRVLPPLHPMSSARAAACKARCRDVR